MRKALWIGTLLWSLCALGCEPTEDADSVVTDPVAEPSTQEEVAPDAPPLEVGVSEELETYFSDNGYVEDASLVNVLRQLDFAQQEEEGVLNGFNLDGLISEEADEESCGAIDAISPDGEEGIDNKFGEIYAMFADLYGPPINDLLQEAINEGRLLLVVELSGVDDLKNDDDVTLSWYRGDKAPIVGGFSNLLLPDQTYYIDESMTPSTFEGAQIIDGWVTVGPIDFGVPLEIFDADMVMDFQDGYLRFEIQEDGSLKGMFGGALVYLPLLEELYQTGASSEAYFLTPYIEDQADLLKKDGNCTALSVAIGFDTAPGYLVRFEDE